MGKSGGSKQQSRKGEEEGFEVDPEKLFSPAFHARTCFKAEDLEVLGFASMVFGSLNWKCSSDRWKRAGAGSSRSWSGTRNRFSNSGQEELEKELKSLGSREQQEPRVGQ